MSRALTLYALASVAIAAAAGLLLTLAFSGPGDAAAIRASAAVVVLVQLVAFGITRHMAPKNLMAGWGAGTLLRFVALVSYALIVAKLLPLPLAPALVSMAALFFLTTLVEPLLLKR